MLFKTSKLQLLQVVTIHFEFSLPLQILVKSVSVSIQFFGKFFLHVDPCRDLVAEKYETTFRLNVKGHHSH